MAAVDTGRCFLDLELIAENLSVIAGSPTLCRPPHTDTLLLILRPSFSPLLRPFNGHLFLLVLFLGTLPDCCSRQRHRLTGFATLLLAMSMNYIQASLDYAFCLLIIDCALIPAREVGRGELCCSCMWPAYGNNIF